VALRFDPDNAGFLALLRVAAQKDVQARGERILAAAGTEHYRMHTEVGRRRFRVAIVTKDARGGAHEAKHHTLLRALDAGRG
jgi:hypothetical protein